MGRFVASHVVLISTFFSSLKIHFRPPKRNRVFNEDQAALMASMQGGRLNNMEGLDNPALDLGPIPHNHSHSQSNSGLYTSSGSNKMSGYFPDSSNSQSLSLSSSTADSMDTVIYKGPGQPSPSIRDWQRSIDSNLERPIDFNHRSENNIPYRDSSVFVDSRSYQMQQASSYHPLQFNGPGGQNGSGSVGGVNGHGSNFTMEYHRVLTVIILRMGT
ncbi:unnamed protein product [Allacma fusca]|uniref:Uncharacterized protein n=1 Tax=Allacma fusca TaxID=39272 RepID=A0A8J2K524_9HEXA|nr:unnamed protein product [Allacma fusca]